MMQLTSAIAVVVLAITLPLIYLRRPRRNSRGFPYPPGPPGHFIIGNTVDIPKEQRHIAFASWAKRYGNSVVSFKIPGFRTVVLNSLEATKDLLEKRSGIYSDRPHLEMVTLMGHDFAVPLMRCSDVWRTGRTVILQLFRPSAIKTYRPLQHSRVASMLKAILDRPDGVVDEVRQYAGSLPMKIVYGKDVDVKIDHYVQIAEETVAMGASIFFPGAIMVNLFPFGAPPPPYSVKHFPKWFPGIHGFKTFADKSRNLCDELTNDLFDSVKGDTENGTANASHAADYIRCMKMSESDSDGQKNGTSMNDREFKNVMATIHLATIAAADTTMSSLTIAILSLLLHPQVQARAQAEIDVVVGRERLPDFSDRALTGDRVHGSSSISDTNPSNCGSDEPNNHGGNNSPKLVYVEAVCRELLRWIVVFPLGVPHAALENDIYEGMFIPKGAIVVGNSWAILHDPELYPQPEEFRPERFITEEGRLNDDNVLAAFGFGRRSCPGRQFANATIWLAVVSLLSVFEIVKAKDDNGKDIDVAVKMEESTICHPKPFVCRARVRDERAKSLIRVLRCVV